MATQGKISSELKRFFEEGSLSKQAAHSLKDGREIALTIDGEDFTFLKVKGRNTLEARKSKSPDVTFQIPFQSAAELVTKDFTSVGEVGVFIMEQIISQDPKQKIHLQLHTGFLGLMTSGYLGILTSGGAEVAKFLASRGLGSLGKLKETISKLKA